MSNITAWQALGRAPWRFLGSRWPWLGLVYQLISALLGVLLLPLMVVMVLLLPLLPLLGLAIGALERRRTVLLGFSRQLSGHVAIDSGQRHNWLSVRFSERATWRELLAVLVDLVLGAVAFVVVGLQGVALTVIGGLSVLAMERVLDITLWGDTRLVLGPDDWWKPIPYGLVLLCVFAYLNTLLAVAQASLLRALCGPRPKEIARNVDRLTQSRAALVAAFADEKRRTERDLHDGVQQELVTLAARLGIVRLELDELEAQGAKTLAARTALETAQDQAEHAMSRLRDTVRGIHPAVLSDRGLEPALRELADRAPVPMTLTLGEHGRLPDPIETAAYYFATEALSNTVKYAMATQAQVSTEVANGYLAVAFSDNGRGGADASAGTGLRGLKERAETLDGELVVVSPVGGPTTLRMLLPLGEEGTR